jgi:shikimate kinase
MKIVLVGYMGSGKSSLGKALSKQYNIPFIDLDEYLEEQEGMSIPTIFETKGAIYFRKAETKALLDLSNRSDNFILSTGGGTPCYGTNMDVILSMTPHVFYLKLSVNSLAKRLEDTQSTRPLIATLDNSELAEFVGKHLFERTTYYNKSHHIISADGQTLDQTLAELVDLIG